MVAKDLKQGQGLNTPIVRLDGVSKRYDQTEAPALAALDLAIHPGEFFSLLGPSGSGKTTTLRLIGGFEEPDTGRIAIDGVDVTDRPPYQRDVNTVFQSYALFPHMTVRENVAYPLRMRGVDRETMNQRIGEALDLVGMGDFAQRLPHQLSGGQRQRIALARALIGRPKVLLLDEPLGALDLQLRQQMQLVLRTLQREVGITFIYVTHDQGEALSMSDRLAVMHDGRLRQIGTPQDVYFRPNSRFVASFIGKSNIVEVEIRADGHAAAQCNGISLALAGHHEPGPASIVLRYEAVGIVNPDDPSSRPARIKDIVFLGEAVEVLLDWSGHALTARMPLQRAPGIKVGDMVGLMIDSSALVVLRD
jgi:spermidine/putrescine transport system ATP-binding protein